MSRLVEEIGALVAEAQVILEDPESRAEDLEKVDKILLRVEEMKRRNVRVAAIRAEMAESIGKARDEQAQRGPTVGSEFKDWGDFLTAVWKAHPRHARSYIDPRLRWFDEERSEEKSTTISGVDVVSGGALIPTEFRAQLYAAMAEGSLFRGRATVIPMASRMLDIPAIKQDTLVAGQSAWFGGLSFEWIGEGVEKTSTAPDFRTIPLRAKKLVGYTISSDEVMADSAVSIGGFLAGPMGFSGGVRFMEDVAFLRGTGSAMPRGILDSPVTITVPRVAANNINYVDLLAMMSRSLDLGNAIWIANRMALPELMSMEGPTGNPAYLWGSAQAGVPTSLVGLPIQWTEKTPAVGSRGDLILASLAYYVIGDRQATTVETTQFDRWRFDQTSWRVVHRVDGIPWLDAPIPLMGGSAGNTLSPFVALGVP